MISYAHGTWVKTGDLALPFVSDTVGTIRGYRIFTACRTINNVVFHEDDHIDRLFRSAEEIYMDLPHSKDDLKKLIFEVLEKNKGKGELLIEIIYSGGKANPTGVAPQGKALMYIIVFPLKLPKQEWYKKGITLATYPYQRQWPEVKLLFYVGAVVAHQTAVKEYGADEVLFVSEDDKRIVLEGGTFNFFLAHNGSVVTHPLDKKILPGITRKVTLMLAQKKEIRVLEEPFEYKRLSEASEAFITSSTRNIVPVVKVDDITIGNGKPGMLTQQLKEALEEYQNTYSLKTFNSKELP